MTGSTPSGEFSRLFVEVESGIELFGFATRAGFHALDYELNT
jgi:hypothetical protein